MQNPTGFPQPNFPPILLQPNGPGPAAAAPPGMIAAAYGTPPLMNFNPFASGGGGNAVIPPPLLPGSNLSQTPPTVPATTGDVASNSNWTQHNTPDGQVYYYNVLTKQSCWEKPDELKTESERLLDSCPWKEYKTENGKTYYHNIITKSSAWTIPLELEQIKKRIETEANNHSVNTESELNIEPPDPKLAEDSMDNVNDDSNSNLPDSVPSEPSTPVKDGNNSQSSTTSQPQTPESKTDLLELFKEILREKNIASNASWENTLKFVANDFRFERFRTHPERKQFFNAYKVQRAKEEKEEARNKIKKAKETLESFLQRSERMTSTIRYRNACEIFRDLDCWKLVPDPERREIFEEAVFRKEKKEKEAQKALRSRNMNVLSDILDSMTPITHRTTWQDAQQLLLDNSVFAKDADLLGMDKEDALIVFEKHIRQLEIDENEEKSRERKILQRQQRLNREAFIQLLDELHLSGKLNSLSKWSLLYHDISADSRFEAMLNQPLSGSTPLDLFKFYVEDLKARYEDEKVVIKDILKRQNFSMTPDTEFSEFVTILSKDARSATLDSGNVKLMHEKLLEREREKYREKKREELKTRKKMETLFMEMLSRVSPPLSEESTWEEVRPHICNQEEFLLFENEEERMEIFNDAIRSLVESCTHHHNHKSGHHRHRCHHGGTSSSSKKLTKEHKKSKKSKKKVSKHRHHRSPSSSSSISNRSASPGSESDSGSSESSLRSMLNEDGRHRSSSKTSRPHRRRPSASPSKSRSPSYNRYRSRSRSPPSDGEDYHRTSKRSYYRSPSETKKSKLANPAYSSSSSSASVRNWKKSLTH